MKEVYAVLPPAEQGHFFHFELNSAWLVEADCSYDVRHRPFPRELVMIRTRSGEGEVEAAGRILRLSSGTLLIVHSMELRRYRTRGECWRFSWWTGQGYGVEPFEFNQPFPAGADAGAAQETKKDEEMEQEILRKLRSPQVTLRRQGIAQFQELFWSWLPEPGRGFPELAPALEYMHYRLNVPVEMEFLARRCGMSLRNFRRRFAAATGKSPKAYWEELRLHAALGLMRDRGRTLKEAAAELEFSSSFHLSRALKKRFGASPRKLVSAAAGDGTPVSGRSVEHLTEMSVAMRSQ